MRSLRCLWMLSILMVAAVFVEQAPGAEMRMLFLRTLQQSKYADVALDYLDMLEAQPNLPPLFRETLDLERSNTYLAWSRIAVNPGQADARRAQAQTYLKKFLAAHPGHPAAAMVTSFTGSMALDRGQALLTNARRTEDASRKASLQKEGLAVLQDARKQLDEASKQYRKWLTLLADKTSDDRSAAAGAEARAERAEVEMGSAEATFKAGLVDYALADANPDPKSEQRTELFTQAAQRFDAAYQQWRAFGGVACLWAHLWHARTLEELGDAETAQDILDEVVANEPDKDGPAPDNVSAELAPLYAEAKLVYFRRLAKQGKIPLLINETGDWLKKHPAWSRTAGYQGIVLERAKAQLGSVKQLDEASRKTLLEQLATALGNVARVESEYKEEGIALRRQVMKAQGTNLGVEETLALGDAALAARELSQAAEYYRRALQDVAGKNPKQTTEIQGRINRVRYAQAVTLFADKKYDEALQAAMQLAQEELADPSTARAASLALSASLSLLAGASDKAAAKARVETTADFVAKKWAGRPEADDASITLGQSCLLLADVDGAMERFQRVKPESRRYGSMLLIQGQIHWKAYQDEKRKDAGARNADRMKASQDKARELVTLAVDRLKNETSLNTLDSAAPLIEALNLLADLLAESKDYAQVVVQIDPVIAKIKVLRPQPLDKPTFRLFVAAVRAHVALGHMPQAVDLALTMVELADDRPEFNDVLVNVAKFVRLELKRADAAVAESSTDVSGGYQKAIEKRDDVKKKLLDLVKSLLKRKGYAAVDMAYLADLCASLEMNDQAMRLYQQLVQRADTDPAFAKEAGRTLIGAKAQVVGLLRTQGKYQEAIKQSDDLIAQSPRSLEPRLAKALILQDWAKDDASKFAPAIAQWTEVRVMLGRLPKKPPEYYLALYHTAECLYSQWTVTHDAALLGQAEQTLQSALVLDSKSIPSELLSQYQELVKRITTARSRVSKPGSRPAGK